MSDSLSTTDTHENRTLPLAIVDLSNLPPVYVLASHLSSTEQHSVEDALMNGGAPLTYDINEAKLVLGDIQTTRRAILELKWNGVQPIEEESEASSNNNASTPAKKKTKIAPTRSRSVPDSSTQNEVSSGAETGDDAPTSQSMSHLSISQKSTRSKSGNAVSTIRPRDSALSSKSFAGKIVVARLEWLHRSLETNRCLPLDSFILYTSRVKTSDRPLIEEWVTAVEPDIEVKASDAVQRTAFPTKAQGIIERAKTDERPGKRSFRKRDRIKEAADKDFYGRTFSTATHNRSTATRPVRLLHETTSEYDEANDVVLPPMPEWVLQKKLYSCERATPLESPNIDFISQLKQIKLARLLTSDEIGVRAYSTSVAALAAYPHQLQSPKEVLALPGCDQKIAHLFQEYQATNGHIKAVVDLEDDPALKALRVFYEIWGVGAVTAREFYYDKGWRDLDDVIEYGWPTLSRVQQIGLKYYDEFQLKIPRAEVEAIAAVIGKHAKRITDPGLETIIVGGYRRGKPASGDVDVILSHPKQDMTFELVSLVVKSLEKEGWITHTLTLNLTNTKRNQEPLPIRNSNIGGHGFDTLDKALVVWQDPHWPTRTSDLATNPKAKNPNPHRRVDIIISPWRTIGCAVAGWTSGTTFQRDLRRYVKKVKGWKFDSSGVRDRATGGWVDLEGWKNESTRCRDWKDAERRVFEGLGLVYREPWDRCTG